MIPAMRVYVGAQSSIRLGNAKILIRPD